MGASSSRGTAELMHDDEAHFWAALRETIERRGREQRGEKRERGGRTRRLRLDHDWGDPELDYYERFLETSLRFTKSNMCN